MKKASRTAASPRSADLPRPIVDCEERAIPHIASQEPIAQAALRSIIAQLRYLQGEARRLNLREVRHFLDCAELDIMERIASGQSMPSHEEAKPKASEIG